MQEIIIEREKTSRKRLFIGLILSSCLLLVTALAALWFIPFYGLQSLPAVASWLWGGLLAVVALVICWAVAGLLLNIWFGIGFPFHRRLRGVTIKLFLPLMTTLGRIIGISKEKIRSSFINVNNEMVLAEAGTHKPDNILLLMPHCLQNSKCKYRLTYDINNCKRCGKCPIAGLLDLHDKYGVHLAIATGGTIARRIVVQTRPRLILAVACERDLASGIQDTYPLHAYGVLNERPHGPCLDTNVQLPHVEQAILTFLDPAYANGVEDKDRGEAIATAGAAAKDRKNTGSDHTGDSNESAHETADSDQGRKPETAA